MIRKLPKVRYKGKTYFVDFRLQELRNVTTGKSIKFTQLKAGKNSIIKKKLRTIRFRTWRQEYMRGLDD